MTSSLLSQKITSSAPRSVFLARSCGSLPQYPSPCVRKAHVQQCGKDRAKPGEVSSGGGVAIGEVVLQEVRSAAADMKTLRSTRIGGTGAVLGGGEVRGAASRHARMLSQACEVNRVGELN